MTNPAVQYAIFDNIAVLSMKNPPLNPMSYDLRVGIVAAIDKANADTVIDAIVLIGNDRAFSSGADITEFGTQKSLSPPSLHTVIDVIESSKKPIIAAISGACMGGGLELALSCHFRVAKPDASIALPEVKLGLLPGAGGTQRLPRLVGVEIALNMIVSGVTIPAIYLQQTKLFHEIIFEDLLEGAINAAKKIVADKIPYVLARDITIHYPNADAYFHFARNTVSLMSKGYPAPLKNLEAVLASVKKPFNEGIKTEGELFTSLYMSSESAALRHLFFAERLCSKIPDVPEDTQRRSIEKIAVIGAGTMGGGITMCFLNVGIPVTLIEINKEGLDRGLATIKKNYEISVKKGKLTTDKVEESFKLLTPSLSLEDAKDADLIIEAVFEDMGIKEGVFRKLDTIAKSSAILATNTSALNVDKIANFTKRPQDVLGMHFFSPANVMKLLEVVRGDATAKDVLATVMQVCKKIKKIGVVSGVCDGFITSRMIGKYGAQGNYLIEQGATPSQVDRALEKWGMVMGPFRMADLTGNDIGWSIRKRYYKENPNMKRFVLGDKLCEMGRLGQKVGLGWYKYELGNREAIPDPIVEQMIDDYRKQASINPRKITDDEIVEHCIFALINEGARILEEGIASRASDIDVAYIYGFGFPAYRGGPMHYANQIGLYNVLRKMRQFANESGADSNFWKPSELLVKLVNENKNFS